MCCLFVCTFVYMYLYICVCVCVCCKKSLRLYGEIVCVVCVCLFLGVRRRVCVRKFV